MNRVYEIFEVLGNGSRQKLAVVSGLESAKARLLEVANSTRNECFVADARTHQIVAHRNVPPAKWRAAKHIFQICYDEQACLQRAELLKSFGYSVMSVIGNEAAKIVLSSIQDYDMFVVDHAAEEEIRREMVLWLKEKYPRVKTLALNPRNQEVLQADYNAQQNEAASWLAMVAREMGNSGNGASSSEASGNGGVRSPLPTTHLGKELHALCHEHHVEMRLIEMVIQTQGRLTQAFVYACPQPNCGVHYSPANGYFIASRGGEVELDMTPYVACADDGQQMYLAEINPEKRDARLWRCPRCNASRSNEEGLAKHVSRH